MSTQDDRLLERLAKEEPLFCQIIQIISSLQWIQDTIPIHSQIYNQIRVKYDQERSRLNYYRNTENGSQPNSFSRPLSTISGNDSVSEDHSEAPGELRRQETVVEEMRKRYKEVAETHELLLANRSKLDQCKVRLHQLYDKIFTTFQPPSAAERIIRSEIENLSLELPLIQQSIQSYTRARKLLIEARSAIESAIKLLPVAVTSSEANVVSPSTTTSKSASLAKSAYYRFRQARAVVAGIPNIPTQELDSGMSTRAHSNSLSYLHGYHLKIESILRTTITPRIRSFETTLAYTSTQLDLKKEELVEEHLRIMEGAFRAAGLLEGVPVPKVTGMAMSPQAQAILKRGREMTLRVGVDDVLKIGEIGTGNEGRAGEELEAPPGYAVDWDGAAGLATNGQAEDIESGTGPLPPQYTT